MLSLAMLQIFASSCKKETALALRTRAVYGCTDLTTGGGDGQDSKR